MGGTAATNPRRFQMAKGRENARYTITRPSREFSREKVLAWRKSGITRASSGTIWTMSTRIRTIVCSRKRNRATAIAASSATSEEIRTVPIATTAELRT